MAGLLRLRSRGAKQLPDAQRGGLRRAVGRVLQGWRERRSRQLRDALPGEFSSKTLRFIRIHACKNTAREAGKTIDCAKWTRTGACGIEPQDGVQEAPRGPSQGPLQEPFMRTNAYVCDRCKHPQLTHSALIDRLGLAMDERSWRRHINAAQPMSSKQLRRAVANALGQGWLGLWQTLSIWQDIDRLEATQQGLRAVKQRVSERKAFLDHGEFDTSREEIEHEFARQLRLIDQEDMRTIRAHLRKDLPTWKRELMEEGLAELQALSADRTPT